MIGALRLAARRGAHSPAATRDACLAFAKKATPSSRHAACHGRRFTAPDATINYYVVEWDPAKLSWAQFRGEVLGPTDPAKAPPTSLRGTLHSDWEALGLAAAPNTTDNGVHASASPFEGLAERMNWLQLAPRDDGFGMALLGAGVPEGTIKAWAVDPQVAMPDGSKGSLFDALEDMDAADCLAKAVAISKVASSSSA